MFKLTTNLAKTVFSTLRPATLMYIPKYNFATNTGRQTPPPAPKQTKQPVLKEQVESEIKFEKENLPDNADLVGIIEKNGWTLQSSGLFHELTKPIGDKNVVVTFFSRSPSAAPEENAEESEDQQDQQQAPDFYEFTVYVRKGNNQEALFADFIVADGQITMGGLSFTGNYDTHKTQGKMERPQTVYQGPDLETLDEGLVNSLTNYFEGLGINEDVINFVEQYSLNSEHPYYVKWLQKLKEYV